MGTKNTIEQTTVGDRTQIKYVLLKVKKYLHCNSLKHHWLKGAKVDIFHKS